MFKKNPYLLKLECPLNFTKKLKLKAQKFLQKIQFQFQKFQKIILLSTRYQLHNQSLNFRTKNFSHNLNSKKIINSCSEYVKIHLTHY